MRDRIIEIIKKAMPDVDFHEVNFTIIADKLIAAGCILHEQCNWTQEDDDKNTWQCSKCDALWILNDGTPQENDMNFCPQCGGKITTQTVDGEQL